MKTFAIIPAGGKGLRSGHSAPKQYLKVQGKELIAYTLEIFQLNNYINSIVVACEPDYFNLIQRLKKKYDFSKIINVVEGGRERQHSVFNALSALYADKNDLVVVHDAARPLLPSIVLSNAIKQAKKKGNALTCIKARDTLMKADDTVKAYLNRDNVYYVQTPQIFRFADLMQAMQSAKKTKFIGTDESMLVKKIGKNVNIVEGSPFNFKVTTKSDLDLFKSIIKNR
ncbi:MAG: 2-C-methyl-D-erythritol 4-phosphate cytidylyltransferase [Ignavibacteriaceae bacterium]